MRSALGARSTSLLRLVLGETLRDASVGIAAGLVLALLAARVAASRLFGVASSDPLVFACAALLLGLVATGAAIVPARRAARTDPANALSQR